MMPDTQATLDPDFIDGVLRGNAGRPGALLAILQQVQNSHPRKYLPAEALEYISRKARIPLSRIYSFATFYGLFNLVPQGRIVVSVCRGSACHTRGSQDLLTNLQNRFGIQTSEEGDGEQVSFTTPDGAASLRTVACMGQCALAPVVEINHAVFGHMNEETLQRELEAIDRGRKE
jgi:NADH-quinone oxidoreductase subunit E